MGSLSGLLSKAGVSSLSSHKMIWSAAACLFLAAGAQALTNKTLDGSREGRQNLGVFNVVSFPNDACGGTNNLNGTCYTSSECTSRGGTANGDCASGFGVCCTFSLACGGSASENNTYAIMSSYSTTSDADPCTYTICKNSASICKLRIDFESFTLDTQYMFTTSATDIQAEGNGFATGKCDSDFLTITNPGGQAPPVICGVNTGQHMYLDPSDSCNVLKIDVNTGVSTTRTWQIKVTQYTCESQNIPRENCLQWHTGTSGTIFGFGWDTSVTTITSNSHTHLQDQNYEICFRRERGYCSLCFTAQIFGTAAIALSSFGVSGAGSTIGQNALDSACGLQTATIAGLATQDYIEIVNLQPQIGTTATLGVHKICGYVFDADAANLAIHAIAGAIVTACTWQTPFKWGVRFDSSEIQDNSGTDTSMTQNVVETHAAATTGQALGTTGFYMAWWQNIC